MKVYRPPPKFDEPSDIKLNVAALLREENKIKKKQEEE
jgi:hypothetical protein